MLSFASVLHLMAFPLLLMGGLHVIFAILSLWLFNDAQTAVFLASCLPLLVVSLLILATPWRYDAQQLSYREAMIFAVLTWLIMGLVGSIPIVMITGVSITDGIFESISGLTTTGATILTGLDDMPKSFLLYRQFLQWLGGLGIVIFVVAVLPMLNVGGMKLLRAETPGPIKDDKLSPRIAHSAHYLWVVYLALTISCAMSYFVGGMSAYDAVAHSFTTVSTGGFSTHDASFGYFQSPILMGFANVFMLLGATSFALHFTAIRRRNLLLYWKDDEARTFIATVIVLSLLVMALLLHFDVHDNALTALNEAAFHLISFTTSTGYGAGNYTAYPSAVIVILIIAGYLGGCAGSTAGGNKFIRNIITLKLIRLQFKRLVHPHGVFAVKYKGKPVADNVLSATMAFMTYAVASTIFLTLLLMMTGLDFLSSLTAVAACINVLGPAFGELGSNFQPVSDVGTWILSFAMILGRLEYMTVLVLFMPQFWKY